MVTGEGVPKEEVDYARYLEKARSVELREPAPNSPLKAAEKTVEVLETLVGKKDLEALKPSLLAGYKQGPGATIVPKTPRERLFESHARLCAEALEIMKRKNADYATEEDPLLNFRIGGLTGIAVRKCDKAVRDVNLLKKGDACVAESRKDTLLDEINYAILELFAEEEGMRP
jgi:hypothetical protein